MSSRAATQQHAVRCMCRAVCMQFYSGVYTWCAWSKNAIRRSFRCHPAARVQQKRSWPCITTIRRLYPQRSDVRVSRSLYTRAKPMWLDCDPGHDDAIALMVACSQPDIDLLGVSTVACNQTVEKTTINAISVLHACGYGHVPVAQGAPKPLVREHVHCAEIHGDSGLDSSDGGRLFPVVDTAPIPTVGALAICDAIKQVRDEGRAPLQLVCTGALTNAALAFMLFPELADPKYVEVTLMGGAIGVGNTGPVQEFNIQTDPEAAHVVFESGVSVAMVPIEVTHTVLATPSVKHRVEALSSPFGRTTLDLLDFFTTTYRQVFKFDYPPVHDPVAVVYVLRPDLFVAQLMRVDVETSSTLSPGQTVCDVWEQSKKPKNVTVVQSVDVKACWDIILDSITICDSSSTLNK